MDAVTPSFCFRDQVSRVPRVCAWGKGVRLRDELSAKLGMPNVQGRTRGGSCLKEGTTTRNITNEIRLGEKERKEGCQIYV